MPTKAELEQELEIRDAEYDRLSAELRSTQEELERVRSGGALARVDHGDADDAPPETRAELMSLRQSVDTDLQALDELRRPPPLSSDPMESTLDIVRANQRERAELQARTVTANNLLSRIAGAVGLDRWDEAGGEILLERITAVTSAKAKIAAKVKELKRTSEVEGHSEFSLQYLRGGIDKLEWALALYTDRQVIDPAKPRRIELVVCGHPFIASCKPEWTGAEIRGLGIALAYPNGAEPTIPVDQWLMYDEAGVPVNLQARVRELVLPSERIIITTPVGAGS